MLSISRFLSQIASQYVARYNQMTARFGDFAEAGKNEKKGLVENLSPAASARPETGSRARSASSETAGTDLPHDTVELSSTRPEKLRDTEESERGHENGHSDSSPTFGASTALETYDRRLSHLRYGLDLNFNAEALQRTIHQVSSASSADGGSFSESLESLSQVNLGLGVDLQLSGLQVSESAEFERTIGVGRYREHSEQHHLDHAYEDSSRINKALPVSTRSSYQLALNRLSLRYQSDAQFSFSHFTRFNSQVTVVGDASPDALNAYNSRTGELAEFASNDLMNAFFDSVDAHFDRTQENLLEKVNQFFDMAADELGISADAISQAKSQLTSTIEGFFDRVESSVSSMRDQVFGNSGALPAPGAAEAPAIAGAITPEQQSLSQGTLSPQNMTDPMGADSRFDFLEAMLSALESLSERPISLADLLDPDGESFKEPKKVFADTLA